MKGKVYVESTEEALRVAREWQDRSDSVWTDGSRLESRGVGTAVAFWKEGGWVRRGTYLGRDKEVFDAEVFAAPRAARLLDEARADGVTPSSRIRRRRSREYSTTGVAWPRPWKEPL